MSEQDGLFELAAREMGNTVIPPLDRFRGAMVCSAVGDALGWPTELLKEEGRTRPPFELPVKDFMRWTKFVGGRWWGYRDDIGVGEYSDDTQLALAVARSISSTGDFEPERFAYSEFPLWLHYQRGGGRSIKTAARSLIQRKGDWLSNFYKQGRVEYRSAGANGAAMRNLPISLVSCCDERRLLRDSFFNAIISHGHPRAILGTMLFGLAVHYALSSQSAAADSMLQFLRTHVEDAGRSVAGDDRVSSWIESWERKDKSERLSFRAAFNETRDEAHQYLSAITRFLHKPTQDYYTFVGALEPSTKGSGIATVCAAIYQFLRHKDEPYELLFSAANQLGSDTDTIACFAGALAGARYGTNAVPTHLWERIQDREYLLKTAARLRAIASSEAAEHTSIDAPVKQQDAYLRILAWEIGLHEMFWDAIEVGGAVVHPALGRGTITGKEVRDIGRKGYVAKLVRISFDCGQSCIFHSRVENNDKVSESLGKEVEKALRR